MWGIDIFNLISKTESENKSITELLGRKPSYISQRIGFRKHISTNILFSLVYTGWRLDTKWLPGKKRLWKEMLSAFLHAQWCARKPCQPTWSLQSNLESNIIHSSSMCPCGDCWVVKLSHWNIISEKCWMTGCYRRSATCSDSNVSYLLYHHFLAFYLGYNLSTHIHVFCPFEQQHFRH